VKSKRRTSPGFRVLRGSEEKNTNTVQGVAADSWALRPLSGALEPRQSPGMWLCQQPTKCADCDALPACLPAVPACSCLTSAVAAFAKRHMVLPSDPSDLYEPAAGADDGHGVPFKMVHTARMRYEGGGMVWL
jgi:hypothetical protein